MVDVTSYTGNAGLGLGSNPNIPVSASPDSLAVLNQTSRDLAAWSQQQNAALFQQKVRDRDNLLNMIATDQTSLGANGGTILPEYLPEIEKAKGEALSEFKKWKGDFNDIDGFMKYRDKIQKASDLSKIAQVNTLGIQDIRRQKAAEPIKYRQADYDQFEKKELGVGLKDIVRPYQKNMYADTDAMTTDLRENAYFIPGQTAPNLTTTDKTTVTNTGGKLKTTQTQTTKPVTGKSSLPVGVNPDGTPSIYSKQPDRVVNYDNILGKATMRFMELGAPKEQQDLLIQGFQQLPISRALETINGMNERIRLYNEQTKGKATPAKELKENEDYYIATDPSTGQKRVLINEQTTPEFAAKYTLAQMPGNYFEAGATSFNKDAGDYLIKNKELAIKREKLGLDRAKAGAYIDNLKAKTKKLQESGVDETQVKMVVDQFSDDFSLGDVTERTLDGKKSIVGDVNTFYIDKVPTGYQNVIGPVYDKKGKLVTKALTPYTNTTGGRPYLKGKLYDTNGKEIKTDNKSLKSAFDESRRKGFNGSFDDYKNFVQDSYKASIRKGDINLLLEDKDGNKVTPQSILDAFKAINNASASKKGQEKLFTEETEEPETSTEVQSE